MMNIQLVLDNNCDIKMQCRPYYWHPIARTFIVLNINILNVNFRARLFTTFRAMVQSAAADIKNLFSSSCNGNKMFALIFNLIM